MQKCAYIKIYRSLLIIIVYSTDVAVKRTFMYMATISAIRFNIAIKTFYDRLVLKGKPKKVAIAACMRKLITILNSVLKNNRVWDTEGFGRRYFLLDK